MRPRRRPTSAAAKGALLAGAAFAVLMATPAAAQHVPQYRPVTPTPAPDGLQPGELYMEADQIVRDDEHDITTAEGSVEVRYQDRTVRADKVIYTRGDKRGQGTIRAIGHVQIINPDGSVEFANEAVLDDAMQAGVAQAFSMRQPETDGAHTVEVKIAANTAVRRSEDVQELNEAIYTPCPVCAKNHPTKPTWSISAERVVRDVPHRLIYFRHAKIRIFGLPVIYLPFFWTADPTAERASGFLAPKIQVSNRRGFSYQQPYLFALTPYADLIVSPQLNTKVNPFLNLEYRERFNSGDIDIRAGYTHERDFDSEGDKFGPDTNRSYILARGGFQLSDAWRAGFTAERTSDPLLFDKYQVGNVYEARGPFLPDDRRLISQVYAMRQDQQSYFSVAAMDFQGLRAGDNDRTFPLVAPLVEAHDDLPEDILGGRLRVNASAVALTRDQADPVLVNTLAGNLPTTGVLPGLDERRATVDIDWRSSYTTPFGLRIEPFLMARADGYSLSDVLTGVGSQTRSESIGRGLATAGADLTYPFYRRVGDATVILEPEVQLAVSPKAQQIVIGKDKNGNPIFLNEDSTAFEFDETTLFRANKFPGYDLYEDGARLNAGARAEVLWDDGRQANLLIGRSFRTETNTVFPATSGLRQTASDWIVAADAQPVRWLTFFARADLDSDTLSAHRLEAGLNVSSKWASGSVRYLQEDADVNGQRTRNFEVNGDVPVGKHWGLSVYGSRDLIQNAWVLRDVGVYYRDDCARVDVIYRREDTVIGRLGPVNSIALRLTLATLGSPFTVR